MTAVMCVMLDVGWFPLQLVRLGSTGFSWGRVIRLNWSNCCRTTSCPSTGFVLPPTAMMRGWRWSCVHYQKASAFFEKREFITMEDTLSDFRMENKMVSLNINSQKLSNAFASVLSETSSSVAHVRGNCVFRKVKRLEHEHFAKNDFAPVDNSISGPFSASSWDTPWATGLALYHPRTRTLMDKGWRKERRTT